MSNILPNDLIAQLKGNPLFDYEALQAMRDRDEQTKSIRFNPSKSIDISIYDIEKEIPWCSNAFYLKDVSNSTLDPLFYSGGYYAQEANSMFLDYLVRKLELDAMPLKVLDLCASPGGMSTLLNSALHEESLLVANEVNASRINKLAYNLSRWGYSNVVISNNDPSAFGRLPGYFDLMVVNAPSSGSIIADIVNLSVDERSLAAVKLRSERQQRVLSQSVPTLRTGGYLIYSTSSQSQEENENIVDWMIDKLDMEIVPVTVDDSWNIVVTESEKHRASGYRFNPNLLKGEVSFFAVLQKKSKQSTFSIKNFNIEFKRAPDHIVDRWIDREKHFSFMHDQFVHLFPQRYEQDLHAILNVLNLKNAGIAAGELRTDELLPSHDLALSNLVSRDIQHIDLDLEQAQKYLNKGNLDSLINPNNLEGWILVRYKGINLGWFEAMSGRINNYYGN